MFKHISLMIYICKLLYHFKNNFVVSNKAVSGKHMDKLYSVFIFQSYFLTALLNIILTIYNTTNIKKSNNKYGSERLRKQ